MAQDLPDTLVWPCPFCGLETPTPGDHLRQAHGMSLEQMIEILEEAERDRQRQERFLLLWAELSGAGRCPMCGRGPG